MHDWAFAFFRTDWKVLPHGMMDVLSAETCLTIHSTALTHGMPDIDRNCARHHPVHLSYSLTRSCALAQCLLSNSASNALLLGCSQDTRPTCDAAALPSRQAQSVRSLLVTSTGLFFLLRGKWEPECVISATAENTAQAICTGTSVHSSDS